MSLSDKVHLHSIVFFHKKSQRLREEEIDRTCMTSDKLGSPLDPLLASLAHFHSSADLSEKVYRQRF